MRDFLLWAAFYLALLSPTLYVLLSGCSGTPHTVRAEKMLEHHHTACGEDYWHYHPEADGYHIHEEVCLLSIDQETEAVERKKYQVTCWDLESNISSDTYADTCDIDDPIAARCICQELKMRSATHIGKYLQKDRERRRLKRAKKRHKEKLFALLVYRRIKNKLIDTVGPLRAKLMLRKGIHSPVVQDVIRKYNER